MSNNQSRKVLISVSVVVIVIVIGGIVLKFITREPESPMGAIASTVKQVEAIEVTRGEIRDELELPGTIESASRVAVFPEIAGTVITVSVDEGDRVRKGQTLSDGRWEAQWKL